MVAINSNVLNSRQIGKGHKGTSRSDGSILHVDGDVYTC